MKEDIKSASSTKDSHYQPIHVHKIRDQNTN